MWHETAVDKNLHVLWLVFWSLRCHLDMNKIMAACLDDSRLMEHGPLIDDARQLNWLWMEMLLFFIFICMHNQIG